jgi:hypothetical protein
MAPASTLKRRGNARLWGALGGEHAVDAAQLLGQSGEPFRDAPLEMLSQ